MKDALSLLQIPSSSTPLSSVVLYSIAGIAGIAIPAIEYKTIIELIKTGLCDGR
jgi:hypothetical protein